MSLNQSHGILVFGLFFFLFLAWLWRYPYPEQQEVHKETEVSKWLVANGLQSLEHYMEASGIKTLEECLSLDTAALSSQTDKETSAKFQLACSELDLELWLKEWSLMEYQPLLKETGYPSRLALCGLAGDKANRVAEMLLSVDKRNMFMLALKDLHADPTGPCAAAKGQEGRTIGGILVYVVCAVVVVVVLAAVVIFVGYIIAAVVANIILGIILAIFGTIFNAIFFVIIEGIFGALVSAITGRRVHINPPPPIRIRPVPTFSRNLCDVLLEIGRGVLNTLRINTTNTPRIRRNISQKERGSSFSLGLYERMTGANLDVTKCSLEWNHADSAPVGGSSVITMKLVSRSGVPYSFKVSDSFKCKITSISAKAEIPHVVEPESLVDQSTIKVSYTAKVSGQYRIVLRVNEGNIGDSEIFRKYLPGPIDSNKTVILDKTAVLVITRGVYSAMKVIPKDSFGNKAIVEEQAVDIEIRKDSESGQVIYHELVVYETDNDYYELLIKIDEEGHYVGWVKYEGVRIGPPKFTIISLSEDKMQVVEKNVKKKNLNIWYEALILEKSKKVYCYISPRQLQVREYFMKLIPTRTFTCKVSPSTQIIFHPDPERFTLDDGFQEPLTLSSPHREILGATFHKFVLRNIGGSEKFQDKQTFFYTKLKEHHRRQSRNEKRVTISRMDLLESARKATKGFSQSDWCKRFNIVFRGEEGLDWGGLSREFFELLCAHLFDASNGLFMRFSDDNHQALVHPNYCSNRHPSLKLKHFYFAGKVVGKCLYESAMGNPLLVKARFTRSFLAQLIGLRINYKYFESDATELYTTKILYILENEVTDLDLVFAEEEFDTHGRPPTVIPLVENGEEKEVTEENKTQYLNALAHYRLTKRVSEEIVHFMKGLNEIVPDNLLSIFDENELELLMCGMGTVSYEDMKEHAVVSGTSHWFQQVLSWFWTVVSSFTQEEMAKLLQFVSGCSQLPPGGFKELNPQFTITSAPTRGRLPTAHTCFNQLCLPEYSSCEQFQTSLMIALNEGGGFGML